MMHNLEQYGQSLEQEENHLLMFNDKLSGRQIQDSKFCSIEDRESIRITGTNIK
jgi:hypothetical protein